jgi:site-specific recombinase XerD
MQQDARGDAGLPGRSLAARQQLLGHASITTTQRYARLSDESVRAEAERLASE